MKTIYFCKDGVIRVSHINDKAKYPLMEIQRGNNLSDAKLWFQWLNVETIFENGLTINSFLKCLEPWKEFFSDMLQIDLDAFIQEGRKPCLTDQAADFNWISLCHIMEFHPEIFYNLDKEGKEDLNVVERITSMSCKEKSNYTGNWKLEDYYALSGYKNNDKNAYVVDCYAFNEIASIPLFLSSNTKMVFFESMIKEDLGVKVFDENAYGIQEMDGDFSGIKYAFSNKVHLFMNVIEGFWSNSFFSPKEREFEEELIMERLGMMEELIEKEDKEAREDGTFSIHIIDGAYDDINESLIMQSNDWESMVKNVSANGINLIQLGNISAGTPPEERIFGIAVKPCSPFLKKDK